MVAPDKFFLVLEEGPRWATSRLQTGKDSDQPLPYFCQEKSFTDTSGYVKSRFDLKQSLTFLFSPSRLKCGHLIDQSVAGERKKKSSRSRVVIVWFVANCSPIAPCLVGWRQWQPQLSLVPCSSSVYIMESTDFLNKTMNN